MRGLVVGCLFLAGCAAGIVRHPDGGTVEGFALGSARVVDCQVLGREVDSATGGLLDGPCIMIEGGTLSTTVATIFSTLGTLAAGYFSGIIP